MRIYALLTAIAATTALTAVGAPFALPRFADKAEIPSVGLSLPIMQGAKTVAQRPPQVFTYQWRRGSESGIEERSDYEELWKNSQIVSVWEDRFGNRLTLGRALTLPDPASLGEHVSQKTFEQLQSDASRMIRENTDPATLARWLEAFSGEKTSAPAQDTNANKARFSGIYTFPLMNPGARAIAFRLDSSGPMKYADNWFVAVFKCAQDPGSQAQALTRALQYDMLGKMRATGLAANRQLASARSRARGTRPAHAIDDSERTRARQAAETRPDWWYMESDNFILLSNDAAAERSAAAILAHLEALRLKYIEFVPPFAGSKPVTGVAVLFRTDEEFESYISSSASSMSVKSTAGLFDGGRRELIIRPMGKNNPQTTLSVIYHEAFHQYLFTAWHLKEASTWFNEGTAEVFAGFNRQANGQWAVRDIPRVRLINEFIKKSPDWTSTLLPMLLWNQERYYNPPLTWGLGRGSGAGFSYAMGYALMDFLYFGARDIPGEPFKDILPTYRRVLEQTGDSTQATIEAFRLGPSRSDTRFLSQVAAAMRHYWESEAARSKARRR